MPNSIQSRTEGVSHILCLGRLESEDFGLRRACVQVALLGAVDILMVLLLPVAAQETLSAAESQGGDKVSVWRVSTTGTQQLRAISNGLFDQRDRV